MKPVRLTIQAFGPYPEREVIDFRDAVETGLFGIYGQTGSGKSTIFSAMTFALFGQPTKAEQETTSLRSDHADASMVTEVEFVFDMGGRRYVVRRRPEQTRPKQRGDGETLSKHEAFLFDATGLALDDIDENNHGKIIAEKKVRDVDAAISSVLGYGPDQFRQIVLLPQGRFEKFLSAKTNERLEILRDLFDVTVCSALMSKLKTDADAAERTVREERAVCMRRLAAEGFESTDAVATGIDGAEAQHAELQENENAARAVFAAAQAAMQDGEKIEARFKASETAQTTLAGLQAEKAGIDTLAERVSRAERARSLLDTEAHVIDAHSVVGADDEKFGRAQQAATITDAEETSAAEALKSENDRAGEIEDFRRRSEELERHQQTLEKTTSAETAVEAAQALERTAGQELGNVQQQLADNQRERREKMEGLKAARQTEAHRQEISIRLTALKTAIVSVETFERAEKDVATATAELAELTATHETAQNLAQKALTSFEEAEQNLSVVQARHLASKLAENEPCPVCGATEHPAPATGTIENVGFEKAFREAKTAWQKADGVAREAEQKRNGMQSVLTERRSRLAGLERPEHSSTTLKKNAEAENRALNALGPKTDIAQAETEGERLDAAIAALETERERQQGSFSKTQAATASERARYEEMIATVPEALRDRETLATTREQVFQTLTARRRAKDEAVAAATAAREAALAARKDRQAAAESLSDARERHRRALETFQSRLVQAGLSEEDFHALKPAMATIESDRLAVEEYRRKLKNAMEAAVEAAEAIREQIRPDLPGIEETQRAAEATFANATEQRSGAWHRLDHLTNLRNELAETLRKLDEAETSSGALRNLAALVNGDNHQKLDLETFAIGAMFDQVLAAANLRLGPMTSNRYSMERDLEGGGRGRRGLGIQVFDYHTGKARSTATLSGGETFISALALALGLADVVESASGKIRLDTIFIDEGFGSLDTESGSGTLDQVLQVLNRLVSQNRAVGLISHVQLVQEAVPNGFYVRKHLAGSSVEARGAI